MMNHGVLAPQFGVMRHASYEAEQAFAPGPAPGAVAPTVIVKRRRTFEAVAPPGEVATLAASVDNQVDAGTAISEPVKDRGPKVFRLDTSEPDPIPGLQASPTPAEVNTSSDGPSVAVPASVVVPAAPAAVRHRRRRDPLRAPTLVQHLVFDNPSASSGGAVATQGEGVAEQVTEASQAEPLEPLFDASSTVEYHQVQAALSDLQREVARLEEGRRIMDALEREMAAIPPSHQR